MYEAIDEFANIVLDSIKKVIGQCHYLLDMDVEHVQAFQRFGALLQLSQLELWQFSQLGMVVEPFQLNYPKKKIFFNRLIF